MRENQREIKILLKNLNRHIFTWRSKCQWLRTDDQGLAEFWYHVVRWVHWSVQQSQSGLNQMYFQRSNQYFCGWVFDRSWTVWSGLKVGLLDFFCPQNDWSGDLWVKWNGWKLVERWTPNKDIVESFVEANPGVFWVQQNSGPNTWTQKLLFCTSSCKMSGLNVKMSVLS